MRRVVSGVRIHGIAADFRQVGWPQVSGEQLWPQVSDVTR